MFVAPELLEDINQRLIDMTVAQRAERDVQVGFQRDGCEVLARSCRGRPPLTWGETALEGLTLDRQRAGHTRSRKHAQDASHKKHSREHHDTTQH